MAGNTEEPVATAPGAVRASLVRHFKDYFQLRTGTVAIAAADAIYRASKSKLKCDDAILQTEVGSPMD